MNLKIIIIIIPIKYDDINDIIISNCTACQSILAFPSFSKTYDVYQCFTAVHTNLSL